MNDIKFIYFPSIFKKNISLINFEHKSFFFQKILILKIIIFHLVKLIL